LAIAHYEVTAFAAARDLGHVAALPADADFMGRVTAFCAAGNPLQVRNPAALTVGRHALRVATAAIAAYVRLGAAELVASAWLVRAADGIGVVVNRAIGSRVTADGGVEPARFLVRAADAILFRADALAIAALLGGGIAAVVPADHALIAARS
jgi:hypothetical protein